MGGIEHRYHADGRLDRAESGRERAGQWSITGSQLCLLLTEVSKREPVCFHVTRDGDELQYLDDQSTVYRGSIRPMPKEKL